MIFSCRRAATLLLGAVVAAASLGGQIALPPQGASGEASTLVETINAELLQFIDPSRRTTNLLGASSTIESRIKQRAEALKTVMQADPERALALALPDPQLQQLRTAFPDVSAQIEVRGKWDGELEYFIADNFDTGQSWEIHRLRTASGALDAFFTEPSQYELKSGDMLTVAGVRIDSVVAGIAAEVSQSVGEECSPTGEQRTAVLLTTFPGVAQPSATQQDVYDMFFDPAGPSLSSYWRDASYGSTYATGNVFGWFTLDRSYACSEFEAIRNAAIRAADSQVDFRDYDRLFIIFPRPLEGCSYIGTATLGCVASNSSPEEGSFRASVALQLTAETLLQGRSRGLGLTAHEGGHGLGLHHASALDFGSVPLGDVNAPGQHFEYGDPTSTLGTSYSLGHYSARQKLQLGWLTNDTDVRSVESPGNFVIRPLGSDEPGLKAIRVRRQAGAEEWLWIQYRQPIGSYESDIGFSEVYGGAQIHFENPQNADGAESPHRGKTYLLDFKPGSDLGSFDFYDAVLMPGMEWQDPYSSQSIRVLSAAPGGLAVSIGGDEGCPVSLDSTSRVHRRNSDVGSIVVSAPTDCAWDVFSLHDWIHISSSPSGTGPGIVTYSIDANLESTVRVGEIAVGLTRFAITQDGLCGVACAAVSPGVLITGVSSEFIGAARVFGCSAEPSYSWDFGDGSASDLLAPFHAYQTAGIYSWSFEASADGSVCSRSGQVQVDDPIVPSISAGGVVLSTLLPNVASISPGSIISVFGENFSSETILFPNLDSEGKIEKRLGGACLEMNGQRLPLFAVTPNQINAQASTAAVAGPAALRVISNCDAPPAPPPLPQVAESNARTVTVQSATPGFFLYPPFATDGYIAARFNTDAVAVAPDGMLTDQFGISRPAKPGEIILLYGTGWGKTTAAIETGELAASAAELRPEARPRVTFGGVVMNAQDILYVGITPEAAGLYQLAIRVPASAQPGNNQVVLTVYGRSTPVGPVVPVAAP